MALYDGKASVSSNWYHLCVKVFVKLFNWKGYDSSVSEILSL